jgi:hypothetical protein
MQRIIIVIVFSSLLSFQGCYSFRGGSVPPHLKTIAVPLFDDQSGTGEPGLREQLTNKLLDRFRQDNSLQVTDKGHADSMIEGIIVSLPDEPNAVIKGESVSTKKVTIIAKVTYQDEKLKKKVWEKDFSNWGVYEITGGPAQRQAALTTAIDKLTEDIVNETVSSW